MFAWSYEDMPDLDLTLISHNLSIRLDMKPIKQQQCVFHLEIEVKIKEKIMKVLKAGFIKPIQHPTWLENIVWVLKKNRQFRICVDFRDLNKACPKYWWMQMCDMSYFLLWMDLVVITRS